MSADDRTFAGDAWDELFTRQKYGYEPEDTARRLFKVATTQPDALRWLSTVVVGTGGYSRSVVQRVASVAARGEDWRAVLAKDTRSS